MYRHIPKNASAWLTRSSRGFSTPHPQQQAEATHPASPLHQSQPHPNRPPTRSPSTSNTPRPHKSADTNDEELSGDNGGYPVQRSLVIQDLFFIWCTFKTPLPARAHPPGRPAHPQPPSPTTTTKQAPNKGHHQTPSGTDSGRSRQGDPDNRNEREHTTLPARTLPLE